MSTEKATKLPAKPISKTITKPKKTKAIIDSYSLFSDLDIHLFKEGKHYQLFNKFGSHVAKHNGQTGLYFAVWAPNAGYVSVIGDFNYWDKHTNNMNARWDSSGIWEIFIPDIPTNTSYKYFISNQFTGHTFEKADPYANYFEVPPCTATVAYQQNFKWSDKKWMNNRGNGGLQNPFSIYEVHLGSWMRVPEDENRSINYREAAEKLVPYVKEMGFTHVEFLPITEHPFYGSWGYQSIGFFAASSRYGTPDDFAYLVNEFHKAGVGVILDWVPSHFPTDAHALGNFDGTHLYEHDDPRLGFHPDWKSFIFNYGRAEVRSFLISSAFYWLEKFHIDGLRVDAVASMLYLDYSRNAGEWLPNVNGGNENLEAISFIKELNEAVYSAFPDVHVIAEESTAWPKVSRPTFDGGLGFGQKWMMGWMHDTLEYFKRDPMYRKHHQNGITFSINYAFNENFCLPLSHDEVVHGKGSLITKMPGDDWQKFANLRLMFAYMFMHPGTKLLFMGAEIAQWKEWNHDASLDWHLLEQAPHKGVQELLKALNKLYRKEKALYENQFSHTGFEFIDIADAENSVISFQRKSDTETVIVVCNFTPVIRENYLVGVPQAGKYKMLLNSDDEGFGGSGINKLTTINTQDVSAHNKAQSLNLTLPPLGCLVLKMA